MVNMWRLHLNGGHLEFWTFPTSQEMQLFSCDRTHMYVTKKVKTKLLQFCLGKPNFEDRFNGLTVNSTVSGHRQFRVTFRKIIF